jgi:hypothetical protein
MTKREAAIVTIYTGYLIGEFHDAHGYAEEIAGRPIQTIEFANNTFYEILRDLSKKDFISMNVAEDSK